MSEEVLEIARLVEKNLRQISFVKRERFVAKSMVIQPGYGSIPASYRFDFEKGNRVLNILYMPDSMGGGVFSVFVEKRDASELLNFMEWIRNVGLDSSFEAARLSGYPGGLDEKVKGFCLFLDNALKDPAILKILRGEAWESTPFDFGDYK